MWSPSFPDTELPRMYLLFAHNHSLQLYENLYMHFNAKHMWAKHGQLKPETERPLAMDEAPFMDSGPWVITGSLGHASNRDCVGLPDGVSPGLYVLIQHRALPGLKS